MYQIKPRFLTELIRDIPEFITNGTECFKNYFTDSDIISETKKAIMVPITFDNVNKNEEFTKATWVPKACIEEVPDNEIEFRRHIKMIDLIRSHQRPYALRGTRQSVVLLFRIAGEDYISVSHNAYIDTPPNTIEKIPETFEEYRTLRDDNKYALCEQLRAQLKTSIPENVEKCDSWAGATIVDRFHMAQTLDSILQHNAPIDFTGQKIIGFENGRCYVRADYILYDVQIIIGITDKGQKFVNEIVDIY